MTKNGKPHSNLNLIVGNDIIKRKLIINGEEPNLKNSSYDLTIGEIFPVGRDGYEEKQSSKILKYLLKPREAVWILSKEEFDLPNNVTSLATLRTSYTKQGLVAFNVGIIDPFYKGPISTVLLNFSKRDVEIKKGEKFFRTVFFEHADVSDFRPKKDESVSRSTYENDLTKLALNDYSKNFLDIPEFDNEFYAKTARNMFYGLAAKYKKTSRVLIAMFIFPVLFFWIWAIALFGSSFFLEKKLDLRDLAVEIADQINATGDKSGDGN